LTRVITIANQKGGVGKTTTAVNLATAIAAVGFKVTLIDIDSQGNASTGFGVEIDDRKKNSYGLFAGEYPMSDALLDTGVPNLKIVASTLDLAAVDIELADSEGREYILDDVIKRYIATTQDEFIIIDTPPSLGLLTLNALVAADAVLIPLQCEFYALEGLAHLLGTIKLVKDNLNSRLNVSGVLLTMYDIRNKLTHDVEADVRGHLGDLVFDSYIPRNVKLPEAPSYGKPALVYAPECKGSVAYMSFAREFLIREKRL